MSEHPNLEDPGDRQEYFRKMVKGIDFEPFFELWRAADGGIADGVESGILSAIYETCADRAIRRGEVFMAEELARRGQAKAAAVGFDGTRCFQLQALGLARSGATKKAAEILMRLSKVSKDSESAGLLARTFRDLAWAEKDPDRKKLYFDEAYSYANTAFENERKYYNGIQAAQFAFFAGEPDRVNNVLKKVIELCREEDKKQHAPDSQDPYWINITLAESALIQGDVKTAEVLYGRMLEMEEVYPADTNATRKVAYELIMHHGDPEKYGPLLEILRPRPLVVFSGHQFDKRDRPAPRFPVDKEKEIAMKLEKMFQQIRPRGAFCSLSMGADLLFAEAAVAYFEGRKIKPLPIELVLAYDLGRSVSDFDCYVAEVPVPDGLGENGEAKPWGERLRKLLKKLRPSGIHEIDYPRQEDSSAAYAYTNKLMAGMAQLLSRDTGSEVIPVVVSDGGKGELGGAADFLASLPTHIREKKMNLF